jgi:hypothetical protein
MSWLITATQNAFITDADARAYVNAVEAADRQTLEPAVTQAIVDFVTGCKADGIWVPIKASCILAGARSLAGALTPLKGVAPTSTLTGTYSRKTGITAGGSLDANRNNNTDPQDNQHISAYINDTGPIGTAYLAAGAGSSGGTALRRQAGPSFETSSRSATLSTTTPYTIGFMGISRSSSADYTARSAASSRTITVASQTPFNGNFTSPGRIAFYSIGESLDLALLDARVTTLVNAFDAAI